MKEQDIDVLARTIWAEARGEGVAGQVAVGRCIRNRVEADLGRDGISDKEGNPGWYFVRVRALDSWRVVWFEFYGVFPYCKTRDVRIRLGWKILTDKFQRQGFAQLVNTFNPFDGYGGG